MILGVDHIALSCNNIETSINKLEKIGYELQFVEKKLENSEHKRPFLKSYEKEHSIAYLKNKYDNSIAIELTKHALPLDYGNSTYTVIFDSIKSGSLLSHATIENHYLKTKEIPAISDFYTFFNTCIGAKTITDTTHISAAMLFVKDIEESITFWTKVLNFKLISRKHESEVGNYAFLKLRTPIKTWRLDIILVENTVTYNNRFIDLPGFNCLALLSNNIDQDIEKVINFNVDCVTNIFNLPVNGKTLKICLLLGPNQEVIEIIEVQKEGKK